MEKGREKGRKQGIEQGITREKMEVAKRLLEEAVDFAFVAKITKLPLPVIHSLRVQEKSI
jgi:predicted transposase/invertase (TIGR01784 family)